ncbi:MAG: PucR family transcriptional regulator, partial [Jiangellaceae bacterium]
SRRVQADRSTTIDAATGWAVTPVGARGETWGRLVLVNAADVTDHQIVTLERAAAAIALNRLAQRDLETLDRQAHGRLISDILRHSHGSARDLGARLEAVGLPTRGRTFTGVVVRAGTGETLRDVGQQRRDLERAEQVNAAIIAMGVSALVAVLGTGQTAVLLSLPAKGDRSAVLAALAERLRSALTQNGSARPTIGVGSPVDRLDDLRLTVIEARQVTEAAQGLDSAELYLELPDIHLDGLVLLLRDDPRLQAFVERELGALLRHDEESGSDLVAVLRAYLDHGRNKTSAADAYHASRLTFYRRLDAIEQVLGVDLDSVPRCMSLYVALLGLDTVRGNSA